MNEHLCGQPVGPAGAGAELEEVVVAPREELASARERHSVQRADRHLHDASLAQRLDLSRHAHVFVVAVSEAHVVALPERVHLSYEPESESETGSD